jgi:hypothetical protein
MQEDPRISPSPVAEGIGVGTIRIDDDIDDYVAV